MTRTPGLRGRLPKHPPERRYALKYLHEYAHATLPGPSYPVDVTEGVTDWQMLGNGPDDTCTTHPNGVGDCTFAGRQHYRMAKAARAQKAEKWESSDELVAEYLAYNHGQDDGANIADLLLSWYQSGKIIAFAPVDHTNAAQIDSALGLFTGVYMGVCLTDDADDLFGRGLPWTVAQGQRPNPDEGHCILKVGADGRFDDYITWGALQTATTDWSTACVDEAWVILAAEDLGTPLIDLPTLQADIKALS